MGLISIYVNSTSRNVQTSPHICFVHVYFLIFFFACKINLPPARSALSRHNLHARVATFPPPEILVRFLLIYYIALVPFSVWFFIIRKF